ncbi:hypothetical protein [Achromobacter spanius]|uniref:hypothetical protein n=1 Tax=Achromobacter spanius TaxID=217203 RepID=UPI0037FF04DB
MDGTMIVNGLRAAYTMTHSSDGRGISAQIQYKQTGPWEPVGPPGTVFPNAAAARAAILSQIGINRTRVLGIV